MLRRLSIHARLLVARWWRWVLARLLGRIAVAIIVRERLAEGPVELRIGRRVLAAAVYCVGGNEGMRRRAHWSEKTLDAEALAVGALALLVLVEARAANLDEHQRGAWQGRETAFSLTLRLLQYLHAIAVLWRGAGCACGYGICGCCAY